MWRILVPLKTNCMDERSNVSNMCKWIALDNSDECSVKGECLFGLYLS